MSGHTLGPWKAVPTTNGMIDIFDANDHDVVTLYGGHSGNARLIAAAPELLELLTGLIEWVEGEQPEFMEDHEWPEFQERVYAVMRKATGAE